MFGLDNASDQYSQNVLLEIIYELGAPEERWTDRFVDFEMTRAMLWAPRLTASIKYNHSTSWMLLEAAVLKSSLHGCPRFGGGVM